jgi:hypothetical protein
MTEGTALARFRFLTAYSANPIADFAKERGKFLLLLGEKETLI